VIPHPSPALRSKAWVSHPLIGQINWMINLWIFLIIAIELTKDRTPLFLDKEAGLYK
jgi:hypothetical protein